MVSDALLKDVPLAGGYRAKPMVKAHQQTFPPRQWRWEIQFDDEPYARAASESVYRSAHDAWEAGRAVLARSAKTYSPQRDVTLSWRLERA
jgi:hypothetical protein